MGNQNLIPYETIVRATEGNPEAVDETLQYYSRTYASGTPKQEITKRFPVFLRPFLAFLKIASIMT